MEPILRAASDLVGTELSDPIELSGSGRSRVLRCRTEAGGTVIVKAYADKPGARRGFASEASGLSLGLAGPRLLGTDDDVPLLVFEDLGDAPSLADVLLGDDPAAAVEGLLTWARSLGQVAAESVHRRDELDRLWTRYSRGLQQRTTENWMAAAFAALLKSFADHGLAMPPGLAEELDGIGYALADDYEAFTPGDTCLDNNLLTPDGLRLIDFESASYSSVFLTAAYARMPFPSCWCAYRLPADVAAQTEAAYREQLTATYPALADDAVWEAGIRRAVAAWTIDVTVWLHPRTIQNDQFTPTRAPGLTPQQVLRHRWQTAAELTEYPALAETMRTLLHEAAADWTVPPLPEYPAFR